MSTQQHVNEPVAQATQLAGGSIECGSSMPPATAPLTNDKKQHGAYSGAAKVAPNGGLGAQSIDGGQILQNESKKRTKAAKCVVQ